MNSIFLYLHMPRYFVELAYKGTTFHGWQVQQNALSVQEELNKALAILCKFPVETLGCGRTDTGVHASQFFAHFDLAEIIADLSVFTFRLNAIIAHDIVIFQMLAVADDAHARFDATLRSYSYYIARVKNPFLQELTWLWTQEMNIPLMNVAADLLLTHENYGCFNKSGGQQFTTKCTIAEARWMEEGDVVRFTISANRFLRGMVRAIVGTMLEVGKEKRSIDNFKNLLLSEDRTLAGQAVPAQGLFLEEVKYPYIISNRKFPFAK